MKIKFDNVEISEDSPVFIIAEAGVNHNGSIELAKKLIDVAADAGVDAVKFQTFEAEKLVTKDVNQADYQTKNTGKKESQYDMLKRLELKKDSHYELKKYSEDKGLIFMSTPFDEDAIDFLDKLGVLIFKAGSGELTNTPYLKKMAKKGKPIILSTGMSNLKDVEIAHDEIVSTGNKNLVLLHCTTNYPTPFEEVNMNAMITLKKHFSDCLVGYSDHTEGILVPIVAASMGACVIEKHFTLDKKMEGPDHKASLEPEELKEMVKQIRLVERIKGYFEKKPTISEKRISTVARKSLVSAVDIPKGTIISKDMIIIKRPGTGIKPEKICDFINKKTISNIKKDTLIKYSDIRK